MSIQRNQQRPGLTLVAWAVLQPNTGVNTNTILKKSANITGITCITANGTFTPTFAAGAFADASYIKEYVTGESGYTLNVQSRVATSCTVQNYVGVSGTTFALNDKVAVYFYAAN